MLKLVQFIYSFVIKLAFFDGKKTQWKIIPRNRKRQLKTIMNRSIVSICWGEKGGRKKNFGNTPGIQNRILRALAACSRKDNLWTKHQSSFAHWWIIFAITLLSSDEGRRLSNTAILQIFSWLQAPFAIFILYLFIFIFIFHFYPVLPTSRLR